MKKWLMVKVAAITVSLILLLIYITGSRLMYFHQDDIGWMLMGKMNLHQILMVPVAEHIYYVFRIFMRLQWLACHTNYPCYLSLSILWHAINISLLSLLIFRKTKSHVWSAAAALTFAVNTNWNEVIWWMSGTTVSIPAIFILFTLLYLDYYEKLKSPRFYQTLSLGFLTLTASSSAGLGLWTAPAIMLVFGIDYGQKKLKPAGTAMIAVLLSVLYIYAFRSSGLNSHLTAGKLLLLPIWITGAVGDALIGRTLIPFDRLFPLRLLIVPLACLIVVWQLKLKKFEISRDFVFAAISFILYYAIIGAGRLQFGLGSARAERYAYIGLILFLIWLIPILKKLKVSASQAMAVSFLIALVQTAGFFRRALPYTVRPQQTKALIEAAKENKITAKTTDYLPTYVSPEPVYTYGDLFELLK